MYKEIESHYINRLSGTALSLRDTKKKLYALGTMRLLVVLSTIATGWYCSNVYLPYIVLAGLLVFILLLRVDNKLRDVKLFQETSLDCDASELKALNYDFSSFDGASEEVAASHPFSLDLDVFGEHSLFQSINRTCTDYGRRLLVKWFVAPLTDKDAILDRQQTVKELAGKPEFMHRFRVLGLANPGKKNDYEDIKSFIQSEKLFLSPRFWIVASWAVLSLWIVSVALVAFSLIPSTILIWVYIATLLLSECKAKKVNRLQHLAGEKVKVLQAYLSLIEEVEGQGFESKRLSELRSVFFGDNKKASVRFKQFVRLTGELEQRSNLLIHILFNPLVLWDIRKCIRLEDWKSRNGKRALQWIETLGAIDAYVSLGTFGFNHPDYVFPKIADAYFEMKGRALGHPLMKRDACVRNDIEIQKEPFFLIITGANMAGKSTYLRTVGVNYLLSCIGAPVCAESLTVYPANLVTSLRTSDSLNDNESYFFAELKRLKMIIDRLQSGEKLFIILDEILKGTNSVDKQKGSLALIEQFLRLHTCGIIATHDLLLGSLEEKFPDNVKNYRFEADIKENELYFSYKLREGIAQNMNASFLMKKMGITL